MSFDYAALSRRIAALEANRGGYLVRSFGRIACRQAKLADAALSLGGGQLPAPAGGFMEAAA